MKIKFDEEFFHELLSQPTAPFREGKVVACVQKFMEKNHIPFFTDPFGNLVVGASSKKAYLALLKKPSREPVRVFLAHMDHPGFHGVKWLSESSFSAEWLGGTPNAFLDGTPVWVCDDSTDVLEGVMSNPEMAETTRGASLVRSTVTLSRRPAKQVAPKTLYGSFRFTKPIWIEDRLVYSKAADDLVGVFTILSLAASLFGKKKDSPPFLGLLTRAEEVGLLGALSHLELGWLEKSKRGVICISLETSRTLPGAIIGKGPVVRLGDRFTVFDAGATHVFSQLAEKTIPGKYQRKLMDGGTCEASICMAMGYKTLGISVPLGNYHNQSFEGGPESRGPNGPAPEFVHLDDIDGMMKLCAALLTPSLPWAKPWEGKVKDFLQRRKKYLPLLKSKA